MAMFYKVLLLRIGRHQLGDRGSTLIRLYVSEVASNGRHMCGWHLFGIYSVTDPGRKHLSKGNNQPGIYTYVPNRKSVVDGQNDSLKMVIICLFLVDFFHQFSLVPNRSRVRNCTETRAYPPEISLPIHKKQVGVRAGDHINV
jgi:hypothetical protein